MTTNHEAEPQAQQREQMNDPARRNEDVQDAAQVKGSFDQLTDPPRLGRPTLRPTVIRPVLILPD